MLVDEMCVFIHDQRAIPAGASACVRNTLTPQKTIPICDMCVCVGDSGG